MTDEPTERFTPQRRLMAAGWQPPDEIARPIIFREELWAAMGTVRASVRSEDVLAGVVLKADRHAIVAAIDEHNRGEWADDQLQRFDSQAARWSGYFRTAISKELAKDPEGVLASLEGVEDPDGDAEAIRRECSGYIAASSSAFSLNTGHRVSVTANVTDAEMIPRDVKPLVSRANIERSARLAKDNRQKMTAATAAAIARP